MKQKCSFILKASLSLVLALLMLFGTMATSLAAAVDELAETGANEVVSQGGYLYIDISAGNCTLNGIGLYGAIDGGGDGDWHGVSEATDKGSGVYRFTLPDSWVVRKVRVNTYTGNQENYQSAWVNGDGNSTHNLLTLGSNRTSGSWSTYTPPALSAPTLKYDDSTSSPVTLNTGATADLTWAAVANADSYEVFKDGVSQGTQTSPYTVTSYGTYTVVAHPAAGSDDYSVSPASNEMRVNILEFYLLGLRENYTWTADNTNKMTYNSTSGLYEIDRNLYQGATTYGGTNQSSPTDTGFKVYEKSTDTYYGSSSGYTINGMSYNHTTLSSGGKNVCLTTKNVSSYTSSTVPYKFTFDPSSKDVYVYYPMVFAFNSHGGTAKDTQFIPSGGTATKPADPERTGYDFGTWVTTDGGSTPYVFTDPVTSDTTVHATWTKKSMTVTVQAMYTDDGTTYNEGVAGTSSTAGGNTITVAPVSGWGYNDTITLTATAVASTGLNVKDPNAGYMLEGIYRDVNGTLTEVSCTTTNDTNTGVKRTATNDSYSLTDDANPTYRFIAKFKKVYYFNVYDSWMEDDDENYTFVAAPPRTITVGTGSSVRATYTYAFGNAAQRGEDDGPQHSGTAENLHIVSSTGNYYEGNLLVAYAGETIKLKYTGLASSDAIRGAFFNNGYRYTTEEEDDDLYSERVYQSGGWSKLLSDDAQDYTYSAATTLYADKAYYTSNQTAYNAIDAAEGDYQATINQVSHEVSWSAVSNYLNIDLELDYKYQIKINDDDYSGLEVQGMNEEGFYNHGDTFPNTFKIVLVPNPTGETGTYRFTSTTVDILDDDGNAIASPSIVVTAKNSSNNNAANAAETTYFLVSGTMPGQNVHLSIPVVKEYNMKLANIVISDTIGNKTMLTECTSNSTSGTGNIGTISAIVYNENGVATETNITSDGTYYTYDGNNNSTTVTAYTDNNSNNKYLKTGVNKDGSMVDARHSVIYKFAFEDGMDANYSFVGWYEGSLSGSDFTVDYSKKLSDKATFEYEPKKDTVVIAVGTRDMYLGGNFTKDAEFTETDADMTWANNRILMKYDPTYVNGANRGRYYYEFNEVDANQEYRFRCYDTKAGTDTTNLTVWTNWDSSSYGQDNDDILFYRTNHGGDAKSFGSFMYKTSDASDTIGENTSPSVAGITSTKNHDALGYGAPVTIYFYAYDGGMSVKATYQWSMAYVSEGRGIDVKYGPTDTIPDGHTKYNEPTATVSSKTTNGETVVVNPTTDKYGSEKIYECQVKEKDGTISITVCPDDERVELQAFVVYNIETKKAEGVTGPFTASGTGDATTYTGNVTIPQNTKMYVVPVYKFTQAYIDTPEMDSHTVYVRTDEIDKDQWGGLVAMYSWGTNTYYNSGGWPGQLLIPSPDGKTFYGELSFFKNGLAGITFSNYNSISGGKSQMFVGTYVSKSVSTKAYSGDDGQIYQTYDYREPISIIDSMSDGKYEDTDEVDLTFALKTGDMKAAPEKNSAGSGAYNRVDDWSKVGYLTNSAGAKVDLNGNKLGKDSTETYRVVAYYTNRYSGGNVYDYTDAAHSRDATGFDAAYAINWTVYDAAGNPLISDTNNLSAVYTDLVNVADEGESAEWISYIAKKLIDIGEPYSGKAVKIAYENPCDWGETVRYSGQWYYDNTNTPINANVVVGTCSDGVFKESKTGSNYESYGYAVVDIAPDELDTDNGEGYHVNTVAETNYIDKVTVFKRHGNSGNISFTADNSTGNFMGWYYKDAETGEFEQINSTTYKNETVSLQFSSDTTYYAFYSAKAKYVFKYKDRFNNDRTYTVEGSDLTDTELGAKGVLNASTRTDDIAEKMASSKLSGIKVFNSTISYTLPSPDANSPAYSLVYNASQSATEYTLSVYSYNASGTLEKKGDVSNTWNTPLDVTQHASLGNGTALTTNKPSGHSDYVFIGWVRYNGSTAPSTSDAILSTQANFGYSITENMSIAPLFGTEAQRTSKLTDSWSTVIDKNVTTTELDSASAGTIFNDSLVAFRYGSQTDYQMDLTGSNECGIIIMAQDRNSSNDSAYSSAFSSAAPATYLDALKSRNLTSAKMKSSTYGDSYAFYIKASSLSSLNRIDLVQAFDYAKFNGGNFKVMAYYYNDSGYTYSAVTSGKLVSA